MNSYGNNTKINNTGNNKWLIYTYIYKERDFYQIVLWFNTNNSNINININSIYLVLVYIYFFDLLLLDTPLIFKLKQYTTTKSRRISNIYFI